MSKKSTRSTKPKTEASEAKPPAAALKKVFFINESLLHNADNEQSLRLERFYHPGKGRPTLFTTSERKHCIMELLEYTEPRRSWLIDSEVCSNGRIYITTPIDATFLGLHHLRNHCSQRAMSLDSIHDEQDESVNRLLTKFLTPEGLKCVADVKKSGDMMFYKYNAERTLAWLAIKTRKISETLKAKQVHCGHSAQSQNYVRSEKLTTDNAVNEVDYLRMACDIVSRYLDIQLHEELVEYLQIPKEVQPAAAAQQTTQKRKSTQSQNAGTKKVKLSSEDSTDVLLKSENTSLLDSSRDESMENTNINNKPTPLKERTLTAKEKALAKGAKGSKSISSFFKIK